MRLSFFIFFASLLVVSGCGKPPASSEPTVRSGGDVPTGGNIGSEKFLIYENGTCMVVNGLFMQRSGNSLTIYGDGNCPHNPGGECSGNVIASLTLGGVIAVRDCAYTYTIGSGSDSVSPFLTLAVTQ